jgi:hypothetical protein
MKDAIYAVTSEGSSDIGDIFLGTSEQFDDCFGGCYAKNLEELTYHANGIFHSDRIVVTIED